MSRTSPLARPFLGLVKWFATGEDRPPVGDAENKTRKIRNRVFLWLIIGYGFFYTCRLSLSVAKKPMVDAGVVTVEELGVMGAALLYVYAIGKFVNGFLADYANIRRFMSIALLCSAFANLLVGSSNGFIAFLVLWALNGWFQSIGSAPSVVSICQWFSPRQRGSRYGVWAGAHNIGEGLTFVGTALIVQALGWRWGFWAPGLACVGIALILLRVLADRPETYGLPAVADDDADEHGAAKESVARQQWLTLRYPIVWVLGLSSACMYMTRYAVNSWGVFYLQEGKGYELVDAASIMAAYPVAGFFGAVFSGFLSDRFFGGRRNLPTLLYGLLLIASLVALRSPVAVPWLDTIAMAAFGFAIGGLVVFLAGLIAVDIVPPRAVGAVKGILGLFSYIGAATQDWISGIMIGANADAAGPGSYDFGPVFTFWIGAAVVSTVLALFAWNARAKQ